MALMTGMDVMKEMAMVMKQVKKSGAFAIPGLCRIKTIVKPATKSAPKDRPLQGSQVGRESSQEFQ